MSTDNERQERELAHWARQALDAAARGLDEETRARLRAARRQALAQLPPLGGQRRAPSGGRRWLAAGALAVVVATLAATVTLWIGTAGNGVLPGLDDLELLAGRDNPEFFADLDFYRWLAEHDHAG